MAVESHLRLDRDAGLFNFPKLVGDGAKDVKSLSYATRDAFARVLRAFQTLKVTLEGQDGDIPAMSVITVNVITGVSISGGNLVFTTTDLTFIGSQVAGASITLTGTDCT